VGAAEQAGPATVWLCQTLVHLPCGSEAQVRDAMISTCANVPPRLRKTLTSGFSARAVSSIQPVAARLISRTSGTAMIIAGVLQIAERVQQLVG